MTNRVYGNLTERQRTGFFLGLGPIASLMALVLLSAVIFLGSIAGSWILAAVVGLTGATVLFFTRSSPNGDSLSTKMKDRIMFTFLRRRRRTLFRPAMQRSFQPPGMAASLELVDLPVPSDKAYAAIANPAQSTLTVMFSIAAKGDESAIAKRFIATSMRESSCAI